MLGTPLPVAESMRNTFPLRQSINCDRKAPMSSLERMIPSAKPWGARLAVAAPPTSVVAGLAPSPQDISNVPSSPKTKVPTPFDSESIGIPLSFVSPIRTSRLAGSTERKPSEDRQVYRVRRPMVAALYSLEFGL